MDSATGSADANTQDQGATEHQADAHQPQQFITWTDREGGKNTQKFFVCVPAAATRLRKVPLVW